MPDAGKIAHRVGQHGLPELLQGVPYEGKPRPPHPVVRSLGARPAQQLHDAAHRLTAAQRPHQYADAVGVVHKRLDSGRRQVLQGSDLLVELAVLVRFQAQVLRVTARHFLVVCYRSNYLFLARPEVDVQDEVGADGGVFAVGGVRPVDPADPVELFEGVDPLLGGYPGVGGDGGGGEDEVFGGGESLDANPRLNALLTFEHSPQLLDVSHDIGVTPQVLVQPLGSAEAVSDGDFFKRVKLQRKVVLQFEDHCVVDRRIVVEDNHLVDQRVYIRSIAHVSACVISAR